MPWVMLAMLGAQAAKHFAVDKPNEEAKRNLDAASQKWGPWINGFKGQGQGTQYDPTQKNDLLSGLAQGGVGGYMMDQNIADHKLQEQYRQMQMKALQKKLGGDKDPSGADDLTQTFGPMKQSTANGVGISQQPGFDQALVPDGNPWSQMTEGMGLDTSGNPGLWNSPTMDELSMAGIA